jgi:hypothetical protein
VANSVPDHFLFASAVELSAMRALAKTERISDFAINSALTFRPLKA